MIRFENSYGIFNLVEGDARALLLNILLIDVIPLARVIYTDKLDGYPAYYVLLPVKTKYLPLQLGKDYISASLAVDAICQIYYTENV